MRGAFAILTIVAAPPTFSLEWITVVDDAEVLISIDRESVQRTEHGVKAWFLWEYPEPNEIQNVPGKRYRSATYQFYVNCEERRSAMNRAAYYPSLRAQGAVAYVWSARKLEFTDNAPGTRGEAMTSAACSISRTNLE